MTFAEAGFFRLRWSTQVLDETEKAIREILSYRGEEEANKRAARARHEMETAFPEALVSDFDAHLPSCENLPHAKDMHVVAAAMKTQASVIVTENLKHFPSERLVAFNIEPKSSDDFIADTIDLDPGKAVGVVQKMRARLNRPKMDVDQFLRSLEGQGLIETVNVLQPYRDSL